MSITFEVSDVEPPHRDNLPEELATRDAIVARIRSAVEASAANLGHLVAANVNGFVQAAHLAFDRHYELVLSPDDVWLCIAQGFAQHIDLNAEQLRDRFVRHEGKAEIVVRRDDFVKGSSANDWPSVFGAFSDAIAGHVGKQRDLVVAGFSTTGPIEKAASEIVLMSAMRHYFDLILLTLCGIPRITLLGSHEDWRSIERRASMLSEYGLEHWVRELAPLLAELSAAAAGRADRALWQSFYRYESRSGKSAVTGWINVLFPYVRVQGSDRLTPNPHLRWRNGDGPEPEEFPTGLAIAPFTWDYLGRKLPMDFVAGFVAVSLDTATLAVRPAQGWAVRDAEHSKAPNR